MCFRIPFSRYFRFVSVFEYYCSVYQLAWFWKLIKNENDPADKNSMLICRSILSKNYTMGRRFAININEKNDRVPRKVNAAFGGYR